MWRKRVRWYIESMRVRVLYFGALKEIAGRGSQEIELPDGFAAAALWERLSADHPAFQKYERSIAIAINHEYAKPERLLNDGDEIGFLPPVSGGAPSSESKAR